MKARIIYVIVLAVLSIFFGVLVGFDKVLFWIIGGFIVGVVWELAKYLIKNKKNATSQQVNTEINSKADEIKQYKDLLESGAITQEEFEQKKKEILGL